MGDLRTTIRLERANLRRSLVAVGPDAPTACGSWTTTDLAIHVASGELAGGLLSAGGRFLVGRGVRVDRLGSANAAALSFLRRRHGFAWALARLDREPPALHRRGSIAAVSLLEVWAHHEDIRAVHDVPARLDEPDLTRVLEVLLRYQRRILDPLGVRVRTGGRTWSEPSTAHDAEIGVAGTVTQLCRWLAGRGGPDALTIAGPPEACRSVRATTLTI